MAEGVTDPSRASCLDVFARFAETVSGARSCRPWTAGSG